MVYIEMLEAKTTARRRRRRKFVKSAAKASIKCKLAAKMSSSSGGKLIISKADGGANNRQRLICMAPKRQFQIWLLLASVSWQVLLNLAIIEALKVSVSIPELVKLNDAFWLNCSHSKTSLGLQQQEHSTTGNNNNNDQLFSSDKRDPNNGEEIYAIKWYKDDEEFYRFLPNAQPKVSIYETNGIQLDQSKSYEGNVFLSKADVNTEGNYRCEILSEAPLFETVRKSKHLRVYALPVRGPRIEILDSNGRPKSPKAQEISYAVGDKIELRCNSAPSKPAARLRWYLNEHELTIPTTNSSPQTTPDRQRRSLSLNLNQPALLGYDVRVTPIEHRQHYKSIYSSHSTLSLVLQQDDLINNKISFKCLASMRQDVPLRSKQLILLTPTTSSNQVGLADATDARLERAKRFLSDLVTTLGTSESDAHVHHRQRPQHHRHSIGRLPASSSSLSASPSSPTAAARFQSKNLSGDLINNLQEDSKNLMMYIYEDSDSTLGSSSTDSVENLESYLRKLTNSSETTANQPLNNNYGIEFNKGDNLEYVQLLRERLARQRSFPASQKATSGAAGSHNLKRLHGPNSLVKSPLYLDEHDSLRPIITWPPLDSGKIMLLPPGNAIVAIPTQTYDSRRSQFSNEQRFILPSKTESDTIEAQSSRLKNSLVEASEDRIRQIVLEKVLHNLNCTCTDGSIDTKLGWIANETPLETRDTRFYPTRVSPDHRQTWLTIGLQIASNPGTSVFESPARLQSPVPSISPLQSILATHFKSTSSVKNRLTNNEGHRVDPKSQFTSQQVSANNQIRLICQATHSMLLYSSSEMITFDFNPPPPTDGNSIDKFASLPSNVIQATSASQSSSAQGRLRSILHGSQKTIFFTLMMSTTLLYIVFYSTKRKSFLQYSKSC